MIVFFRGEMQRRLQDGFSIFLPAADAVRMFGGNHKLSHIAMVPQVHRQPHLILKFSVKLDESTPSANSTTDNELAPESMHSGRAFLLII